MGESRWEPQLVDLLEASHVAAVLEGESPMVCVRGFLSDQWCAELVRRFDSEVETSGRHLVETIPGVRLKALALPVELVDRFPAGYLERVAQDAPRTRRLFDGGVDPLSALRLQFASWGWNVVEPRLGGAPCHDDIVWALGPGSASPVHVDTFFQHHPCELSRFPRRLSYNVFLQTSEVGGVFVAHRRPWAAGDHVHSVERGKPATSRAVLGNAARAEYAPMRGDLVVFDSCAYHEVTTTGGGRDRVTAHSTILMDPGRRAACFCV